MFRSTSSRLIEPSLSHVSPSRPSRYPFTNEGGGRRRGGQPQGLYSRRRRERRGHRLGQRHPGGGRERGGREAVHASEQGTRVILAESIELAMFCWSLFYPKT